MILKVDHIAVAVKSLEERLRFWSEALEIEPAGLETVESEGVKVAFLRAGQTRIELLEPLAAKTPVGKFLAKHGEGLHHITFEVESLDAFLERLRERGVKILDDGPRAGAEGRRVAFLHPRSAGGVLVELCESAGPSREASDIAPGQAVLVYLREPQEKLWGILRRLDGAGVVLEGIDLTSFDDWVAQIERGEERGRFVGAVPAHDPAGEDPARPLERPSAVAGRAVPPAHRPLGSGSFGPPGPQRWPKPG